MMSGGKANMTNGNQMDIANTAVVGEGPAAIVHRGPSYSR